MHYLIQQKKKAIVAILLLAVLAEGCASDKIRTNSYKMLGAYAVAMETAADLAEDPTVPTAVIDNIKEVKDVASPLVRTLYLNAQTYANLQDQIKGIRDAGGEPPQIVLAQLQASLIALQKSMADCAPLIAQIVAAVRNF